MAKALFLLLKDRGDELNQRILTKGQFSLNSRKMSCLHANVHFLPKVRVQMGSWPIKLKGVFHLQFWVSSSGIGNTKYINSTARNLLLTCQGRDVLIDAVLSFNSSVWKRRTPGETNGRPFPLSVPEACGWAAGESRVAQIRQGPEPQTLRRMREQRSRKDIL